MFLKINKIIWYVVAIQICLSFVAIHKDADTILDFAGMAIWCTWGTILLAFLYTFKKPSNILRAAILGAFALTSIASIWLLTYVSFTVLKYGPLNESGLIFIAFPFGYVGFGSIGVFLGIIFFFLKRKYLTLNLTG